ncbi:TrgA family protein [Tabrizicola sp. M-4]|uniref:TrgA family protein n=1 Tax=Tabrizicola sp. M-4 TaxID=3055847 RepID=UPI003DA7B6A3
MPTAAKLVAALCFAFLGWVVAIMIENTMPESARVGRMYEVAIACGVLMGWFISGAARRAGMFEAASTGMRTAVIATVSALLVIAVATMLNIAMRGRYRGPMDALLDIVDQFFGFGSFVITLPVLVTIILGGAVAGMITEAAGRRWR